jgi:56kDa selenium binding protein (SBP56)
VLETGNAVPTPWRDKVKAIVEAWYPGQGHRIHFWDLRARRHTQTIDLGANHQMALEVRPAHDPVREYGFLGGVRRHEPPLSATTAVNHGEPIRE